MIQGDMADASVDWTITNCSDGDARHSVGVTNTASTPLPGYSATTAPKLFTEAHAITTSSSSELFTGAKAEFGAAVGGIALIALVALGFFLWPMVSINRDSPYVSPSQKMSWDRSPDQHPLLTKDELSLGMTTTEYEVPYMIL
ncbi:hypothetical protein BDW02DRAFT_582759 [Decorospora gaudefroyi]|uniref:Uncharacterized protein n=1 Tax=Decorospora gaudefroyi TaxID=184978 RepID=A0A6A5JZW8_9PLEO|nr:hypothetical protein BDW02DRAFT_582759 [Decorospora gaudefroyi]